MNIKILSSLTSVTEKRKIALIIGTHNGMFHLDEVLACAILCLLCLINRNMSVQIVRTRDSDVLNQCDICVDIGGGDFDHHQPGFNKTRENGIKYASAGLVWKEFGKQLINLLLEKHFSGTKCNTDSIIDSVFETFDSSFIVPVDSEDNGKPTKKIHCFSFISSFLPLWFNNSQNDFNKQFYKVLVTTMAVLEKELKTTIGKEIEKNNVVYSACFSNKIKVSVAISFQNLKAKIGKVTAKYVLISNWNKNSHFYNGIFEIPSQTMDWVETVININSTEANPINFVIFPYLDGGWAAQCVPPSLENKFGQRISFPKEWAGQTDKLPEISGVAGATSCHNGRFFVRASNKEAIIEMCNIATNSVN